ncbi:hypothetical protein NE237_015152 [Protea cynaroides]|uniref:Uncharacterized protein n=1 Tax=Protea cynaroides TaxID=273540 RepID=A0A9Q0KDP6_9MAGN|nr:hypothetical protein NE237_015152 [Protea cynaroides]
MKQLRKVCVFAIVVVLLLSIQPYEASCRVLKKEEEEWMKKGLPPVLDMESLPKGDSSTSEPSGCTNIPGQARRSFDGDQWLMKHDLVFHSLPEGNEPPSGPSACTNIPGTKVGICPPSSINSKKFARGARVEAPINFR